MCTTSKPFYSAFSSYDCMFLCNTVLISLSYLIPYLVWNLEWIHQSLNWCFCWEKYLRGFFYLFTEMWLIPVVRTENFKNKFEATRKVNLAMRSYPKETVFLNRPTQYTGMQNQKTCWKLLSTYTNMHVWDKVWWCVMWQPIRCEL